MIIDDLNSENKRLREENEALKIKLAEKNSDYAELYFASCVIRNKIRDLIKMLSSNSVVTKELSVIGIRNHLNSLENDIENPVCISIY
jgi:sugar-specific transcriptional regulator TrmB